MISGRYNLRKITIPELSSEGYRYKLSFRESQLSTSLASGQTNFNKGLEDKLHFPEKEVDVYILVWEQRIPALSEVPSSGGTKIYFSNIVLPTHLAVQYCQHSIHSVYFKDRNRRQLCSLRLPTFHGHPACPGIVRENNRDINIQEISIREFSPRILSSNKVRLKVYRTTSHLSHIQNTITQYIQYEHVYSFYV